MTLSDNASQVTINRLSLGAAASTVLAAVFTSFGIFHKVSGIVSTVVVLTCSICTVVLVNLLHRIVMAKANAEMRRLAE